MTSGWADLARVVTAASPRPQQPVAPTSGDPGVRWTVNALAQQRITLEEMSGLGGWITEDLAMQIPAFAQGVNLISGTCGAIPWWTSKGLFVEIPTPQVIATPDPEVPASVTWTRVYRDLVLHPYSWCLITERYADGFPARMRHLTYDTVNWQGPTITVEGKRLSNEADLIRFDSPVAPGALWNGRRILHTAFLIEEATRRYARMDTPAGYLKQTGGPDLLDAEVDDLLTGWETARETRTTGYLSANLDYKQTSLDPKALQLVEARAANAVDIARLLNLPPLFVNAETGGSLTYSTVESQQQALLSGTLNPYLTAVQHRLTMRDITARGIEVRPRLTDLLRTDQAARFASWEIALRAGFVTVDEVRYVERLPPIALAPFTPTSEDT